MMEARTVLSSAADRTQNSSFCEIRCIHIFTREHQRDGVEREYVRENVTRPLHGRVSDSETTGDMTTVSIDH